MQNLRATKSNTEYIDWQSFRELHSLCTCLLIPYLNLYLPNFSQKQIYNVFKIDNKNRLESEIIFNEFIKLWLLLDVKLNCSKTYMRDSVAELFLIAQKHFTNSNLLNYVRKLSKSYNDFYQVIDVSHDKIVLKDFFSNDEITVYIEKTAQFKEKDLILTRLVKLGKNYLIAGDLSFKLPLELKEFILLNIKKSHANKKVYSTQVFLFFYINFLNQKLLRDSDTKFTDFIKNSCISSLAKEDCSTGDDCSSIYQTFFKIKITPYESLKNVNLSLAKNSELKDNDYFSTFKDVNNKIVKVIVPIEKSLKNNLVHNSKAIIIGNIQINNESIILETNFEQDHFLYKETLKKIFKNDITFVKHEVLPLKQKIEQVLLNNQKYPYSTEEIHRFVDIPRLKNHF